ncbi:MAG: hypothetical protein H0T51_06435 [Pirellulales bacterium]|nr:hypothetical protein [Pirellulales bacterium]
MSRSSVESDWLRDTLAEIARRLRRSCEDHACCAAQLEQIVADLQLPDGVVIRPRSPQPTAAVEPNSSPLEITVSVSIQPRT